MPSVWAQGLRFPRRTLAMLFLTLKMVHLASCRRMMVSEAKTCWPSPLISGPPGCRCFLLCLGECCVLSYGLVYSRELDLKKPIYQKTAAYGHFGRNNFPWEVPKKLKYWICWASFPRPVGVHYRETSRLLGGKEPPVPQLVLSSALKLGTLFSLPGVSVLCGPQIALCFLLCLMGLTYK